MAIALITGTSMGIGLATAVALGRAGHNVYATMRSPHRTPELRTIATQEALPITVLPLDVDDDGSVRGAVEQVLAEQGRVDVLVNNAGIGPNGPIEELPLDVFRQTMETNFFGALGCIQEVLPGMRAQRSGCIINVTSVAGRITVAP
jgi:NAD(P)-dependent dehydrogenase (short-subunit alcohol dehydrogenase family)